MACRRTWRVVATIKRYAHGGSCAPTERLTAESFSEIVDIWKPIWYTNDKGKPPRTTPFPKGSYGLGLNRVLAGQRRPRNLGYAFTAARLAEGEEEIIMAKQDRESRSWWTPEFTLVVVMLGVLVILVLVVLGMPVAIPETDNTQITVQLTDILRYRTSILTAIITAFGAWVGAGAAYFFGRENLREAANSMLAMREPTPEERLRKTQVREIPPRLFSWMVSTTTKMKVITEKLTEKTHYWFIPIVDEKGVLETVIEEEAVWRLLQLEIQKDENKGKSVEEVYQAFEDKTIAEVLKEIRENEDLSRFGGCHVTTTLTKSAADAYDSMQDKWVNLAIVVDKEDKPTHFFTTGDVREVLMKG
ncbi:MAG: hypothetical protein L6435_15120 [Anaerolineae bacterium]|nr:hypothetical protein [Anaerolineae bacterium]